MRLIKFLVCIPLLFITYAIAQNNPAQVNVLVTNFSGSLLEGEEIWFKSVVTKKIYKGKSDENGKLELQLAGPDNYIIMVRGVVNTTDYSKLILPTISKGTDYGVYEVTIEIDPAKEFTLDHVYFETGKSVLKSESFAELNELHEYLLRKKSVIIEIAGHTDNVGDSLTNLKLSRARAESVKTFLVKKGIEENRIKPKGYGESQPIADNNTEAGRKLNRRTEVRILKE